MPPETPWRPAEAAAAGICLTARMFGVVDLPFDPNSRLLHPGRCRFCAVDKDTLLAKLKAWNADAAQDAARREFGMLSKSARFARRREAQEPEWWTDVTP